MRFWIVMTALWAATLLCLVAIVVLATQAHAHSWYSKRSDPVLRNSCCGGTDCAELLIEPGVLEAVPDGYRIRLTVDQAKRINPYTLLPLDTVVPWDRVQDSEDGKYHLCIPPLTRGFPHFGVYCFFAPPST